MQYRKLGNSGLVVSLLGYGANNLGRKGSRTEDQTGATEVINAAIDLGINYFDSADVYGYETGISETFLGKAVASRRDEVVIGTKFGLTNDPNPPASQARGSRRYLISACEASLKRLGTDWIDLYFYHSPDPRTPIEETVDALETLVDQGKIRYYGCSNMAGWQLAHMAHLATPGRFIAAQNHYNLIDRRAELEIIPAARQFGLGVVPYYPLASGLLTGKYTDGQLPTDGRLKSGNPKLANADWQQLAAFKEFCAKRKCNQADIALAWLASTEVIGTIIAGATKPEQLAANANAFQIQLSDEDLSQLSEIFPAPQKVAPF